MKSMGPQRSIFDHSLEISIHKIIAAAIAKHKLRPSNW
eukprot:COSAG02_NODE_36481_length_454_cov_0.678873_1_plen_37_part_01